MQHPCASDRPTLAAQDSCATPVGATRARVRDPMAVGTETLKRTPLYDRHVAAGAKLVPFAGWEMPVQYAGIKEEHLNVRAARGHLRRLAHGRDRDDRAGRRGVPAADPLQRRDEDRRERGAVQRPLQGGRGRPRRPLHLPPRSRPLPHRHQRFQPREGSRVVPGPRRAVRRDASRPPARLRDARRPGARGARHRRRLDGRGAAQALPHRAADRRRRARRARLRHRLHGRGRRRAARRARARHARSGTRSSRPERSPRASARATRCAWRSASTSTATT